MTSATVLFVELLLIRWIPANLVYVGFFNNFILLASFLGIGLGLLAGRRFAAARLQAFALPLLLLVVVVAFAQVNVPDRRIAEVFVGASRQQPLDADLLVLGSVVLLTVAGMAGLAMPLGPLLRSMPPLRAYAVDIAGSLAGIVAFAALSASGAPPALWFVIAGALVLVPPPRLSPTAVAGVITLTAGLAAVAVLDGRGDLYSPYYRVSLGREPRGAETLAVNGLPFQTMWPASAPGEPYYEQVFRWFPARRFDRALVVGSGTGVDVAILLRHGVGRIEAVEIDPLILDLGVRRHPDRPYDDPRVRRIVDDGRAFLRSSAQIYDLVIFAQTDSLTLATATANLRLESFLFTREAFASVRDHLAPDGIFVLYNYYRELFLVERYAGMLQETFGAPPLVRSYSAFSGVQSAILAGGPAVTDLGATLPGDAVDPLPLTRAPSPATDDWPFPYLRERELVPRYAAALGLMLALAGISVAGVSRAMGLPRTGLSPHFFVLGAAFLLLETRSLVTFSLLFGTTWIVNAVVFFAILVSVLAAIAVTTWARPRDRRSLYVGLFAALAVAYLAPPNALLLDPIWLRFVVASAVAFAPIFFANLVFAQAFRDATAADMAFASNLLGAMLGGLLEWAALVTGYQALVIVVAALYAAALLFATRIRILGDRPERAFAQARS